MATKKKAATEETTAATEATVDTAVSNERTFKLSSLQKYCRKLFGVSTTTFVGATNSLDKGGLYTVEEIKSTIEKWCKKEVK